MAALRLSDLIAVSDVSSVCNRGAFMLHAVLRASAVRPPSPAPAIASYTPTSSAQKIACDAMKPYDTLSTSMSSDNSNSELQRVRRAPISAGAAVARAGVARNTTRVRKRPRRAAASIDRNPGFLTPPPP